MFEDIVLAMAQEVRLATEAVERRLRARQLGEAWVGLAQSQPSEAYRHQHHAEHGVVQVVEA